MENDFTEGLTVKNIILCVQINPKNSNRVDMSLCTIYNVKITIDMGSEGQPMVVLMFSKPKLQMTQQNPCVK